MNSYITYFSFSYYQIITSYAILVLDFLYKNLLFFVLFFSVLVFPKSY